ncbi:glutathione peroxidase [Seonamhaeicola sp. S2-3]|uniref:glutathione peroxidase n=1 Tax=Seonamhaeicola sp. S2-3 TaxID=1936081 RepID=UPI000972CFC3|nr:glutathione peroxidase [Seonamhaeicola sp. S2-3]APY12670.1 glutathione peroxidase [Seonamhaeicola sp. S2-3]
MDVLKTFIATLGNKKKPHKLPVNSIYDISINALNGSPINLSKFKGKYILFVNVASKCGFTPQYQDLQKLHETYSDNLQVIGVPCNQFGGQEPGNTEEIKSFCEINYGVSFLITEKIDVKGKKQHALYTWLTQKINNGKTNSSVKWNFQKYLVDPNGNLIDFYLPYTKPLSKNIIKHL